MGADQETRRERTTEDHTSATEISGAEEAAAGGLSGGYAAGGNSDTLSPGSAGEPTDEENLKDATTGPASAPGYGVINTKS